MSRLEGKVAIVTGGGSGIGAACCQKFAAEGAKVIVADISRDNAERVASTIGVAALATWFDAGDGDSIRNLVHTAVEHFGALHILHNNAALTSAAFISKDTTAIDIDLDVWDRAMSVNARGYLLGCRYALPHIIKAGGGAIINTSSNAALHGDLDRIAYGSSKGAINSLTLYVATQYGRQGVRCNAICPGLIVTPAVQNAMPEAIRRLSRHIIAPRVGRPEDIANLACFLASDEAAYITGQIISVDGGFRAKNAQFADLMDARASST
jgi:NAD(P)-dependent dehydrogenase (short-subunit alcohol dehydrogenase family)